MKLVTELYESAIKDRNDNKYGKTAGAQCICCSKPMKDGETKMVHMNTLWQAMHVSILTDADAEAAGFQSQGYFEIGNSCAKKMPAGFVHQ